MKTLNKIKNLITRTLFYDRWTCNACGKEIFSGYFCQTCQSKIVKIKENKCNHCGRLNTTSVPFCDSCAQKNLSFDKARSVFVYKEPLNYLIQNFKYNNLRYLADYFSEKLAELYLEENFSCDFITFVPMSDKRLKQREYNQAEILAKKVGEILDLEVKSVIEKVKETENQANLSFVERTKNLKGAFKVKKKDVEGSDIVLIDDVLTTGSTVEAIAFELKRKGAKKVFVLTLSSVSKIKIEN